MKRFDPAPLDVEIVDIWPPGTLDAAARYAYETLHARGRIRLQRAYRDPASGKTSVRYLADIPAQWIHEELGRARKAYDGTQMTITEVI